MNAKAFFDRYKHGSPVGIAAGTLGSRPPSDVSYPSAVLIQKGTRIFGLVVVCEYCGAEYEKDSHGGCSCCGALA